MVGTTITSASRPFGAVLTAMATPFDKDLKVDLAACRLIAAHLVDGGCAGIVVNGTTGESPTTSVDEKFDILSAVREEVGSATHLVAGVGTYNTATDVDVVKKMSEVADGLLMLPPYYSKPTQEGIYQHMMTLAEASNKPVMIYDIPGRVGVPIETETLIRLAQNEKFVAVKDAKGDLDKANQVMAATDLAWYSGDDPLNLAHMGQGASGFVSVIGHAVSNHLATMATLLDAGRLPQAAQVHRNMLPVIDAMCRQVPGASASKAALQALGVLDNRRMRMPMLEAPQPVADSIAKALRDIA